MRTNRAIGRLRFWLTVTVAAIVSSPLRAATLHVPANYATIQSGIDAAAFGDTVLVAPGTYSEVETRNLPPSRALWTACAFLKDGVVLKSEVGPTSTVIDMGGFQGPASAVINARLLPSTETVVDGFTITGAPYGGRGIYAFLSSITVRDCVIRDIDIGLSNGGGMLALGTHRVINCEFVNCHSDDTGGAIYHSDGHLDLIGCTIRECDSPAVCLSGGGGGVLESAYIEGCKFLDNHSSSGAGAVDCGGYFGGITVTDCYFRNNLNTGTGSGAVDIALSNRLIENSVFVSNGAMAGNGQGGAINVTGSGSCLVRGNTFFRNFKTQNSAAGAAAAFQSGVNGSFENNIIVESSGGGAVFKSINAIVSSACNVYWSNPSGSGMALSATDRVADPLFCDSEVEDLTLRVGSPCLAEDALGCGLIGAFEMGCGAISVEPMTWGRIKAAYRELKGGTR